MLVSLRRAFSWPGTSIDWLVQDTFAEAVSSHPDLTGVVAFPRSALASWTRPETLRAIVEYLRRLGRARYDLVLDCQGLFRSGLFAAATGAPRRIGLADAAELGWLGVNEHVHGQRGRHAVDRMLALAETATGCPAIRDMRLYTTDENRTYVVKTLGLASGSYVLLAPTSRWPGKLWPQERYISLCERLPAESGGVVERIVFVGSGAEAGQCAGLARLAASNGRVLNLLGKTSIGQLMAVVEGARLVIGSDSAALHMAVGLDRPLIGLYGPTRIELVGPYRRERDVIQHVKPGERLDHKDEAAGRALMERISVEEVLERSLSILSGASTLAAAG